MRNLREPDISINGRRLTEVQARVVRMALATLQLTMGQYGMPLNAETMAAAREVQRMIDDTEV